MSTPGSGLDKRQCTLQICVSPGNTKIKIAIIFRGKGKRITDDELKAYHKEVHIYCQTNAWADTEFSVNLVRIHTLKQAVYEDESEFVLFCDNLSAQVIEEFLREIHAINGIVWFGEPGSTDIWQPVDNGFGKMLKTKISSLQEQWLEQDENIDLWTENSEKKLDLMQRIILITHWVGNAYNQLMGEEYSKTRYRCFEKTGCLITADGSEDTQISPEGVTNNVSPHHCLSTPAVEVQDENEPDVDDDISELEEIETISEERIDLAVDRTSNHPLVNRTVTVCYDEWHIGTITWCNTKLDECRVLYADKSKDYLKLDDFNGVDVILIY